MKDIEFDKLMSVQVIDTGTAKILGEYYIKGKITDFKCNLGIIFIIIIVFFIFSIITRNRI